MPLNKHYLKYIDYYTQYNVLNRDRIKKRNKKTIALKQKMYRDNNER